MTTHIGAARHTSVCLQLGRSDAIHRPVIAPPALQRLTVELAERYSWVLQHTGRQWYENSLAADITW